MARSDKIKKIPLLVYLPYNFRKVIGLWSPLSYKDKNNSFSNFRLFYSIALSIMYSVLFYRIIIERLNITFPKETLTAIVADGLIDIFHFCMVLTSWLIFAFRQKKVLKIFDIIEKTELNGRVLGITDHYEEMLKTLSNRTLFVICVFLGKLILQEPLAIRIGQGNLLTWFIFKMAHIVNHIVVLTFITNLEIVRLKFYHMNSRLRHLSGFSFGRGLTLQQVSESQ